MLIKFAADNNWEMLPTLMQKNENEIIKIKTYWVDIWELKNTSKKLQVW